jgi:RNA polymerase subunit RPABC4/transcription elongation factor Spt4
MNVRVCVECGEEYRPETVRCADCGGELEDRLLDDDGNPIESEPGEADEPAAALPAERRIVFVTPKATELVPLAEALREAGIEYHLAEQPPAAEGAGTRFVLLVAEPDAQAALQALAHLLSDEEGDEADLHTIETRFEADRGYVQCPACGADQAQGALECAECGLTLGAPDEGAAVCARCSAPLPEAGATCPACGSTRVG